MPTLEATYSKLNYKNNDIYFIRFEHDPYQITSQLKMNLKKPIKTITKINNKKNQNVFFIKY